MPRKTLDILSYDQIRHHREGVEQADIALYLTPEVVDKTLATVGTHQAESGGVGLGRGDRHGVDLFEFDTHGSSAASATEYRPDTTWLNGRLRFWLSDDALPQRCLHAVMHSHPGSSGVPSGEYGKNIGDLAYARAILDKNPWMPMLYLPIFTNVTERVVRLWSWVVHRTNPGEAHYAPVVITSAVDFPARIFDESWMQRTQDTETSTPTTFTVPLGVLDIEEICERADAIVAVHNGTLWFSQGPVTLAVTFPDEFPRSGPVVELVQQGAIAGRLPYGWKRQSPHRAELRVAYLLRAAFLAATRRF